MTSAPSAPPPPSATTTRNPRRLRAFLLIGGGVAPFLTGLGVGNAVGQANAPVRQQQVAGIHPQARTVTVTAYVTPTTSPDAVPSPVAAPPPAQPRTSFSDGTYEVGVDIAPGRYKTAGDGFCYWERAKSDSGELSSILANDNVDGPATVTVKTGEFFKSKRCGTWMKS
jgi:hypothetical protein